MVQYGAVSVAHREAHETQHQPSTFSKDAKDGAQCRACVSVLAQISLVVATGVHCTLAVATGVHCTLVDSNTDRTLRTEGQTLGEAYL